MLSQEEHEGMTKFRRALLVGSGAFSVISLLILSGSPALDCPGSNMRTALWLTFSIHISSFFMLLLHFINLGTLLRKLGRSLGLYYFYIVGAMIATQVVFFQGGGASVTAADSETYTNCFKHSPGMYSWLVLQIVAFYGLVAYGIALCGAYICWESEAEEKKLNKIVKEYAKARAHVNKQKK